MPPVLRGIKRPKGFPPTSPLTGKGVKLGGFINPAPKPKVGYDLYGNVGIKKGSSNSREELKGGTKSNLLPGIVSFPGIQENDS